MTYIVTLRFLESRRFLESAAPARRCAARRYAHALRHVPRPWCPVVPGTAGFDVVSRADVRTDVRHPARSTRPDAPSAYLATMPDRRYADRRFDGGTRYGGLWRDCRGLIFMGFDGVFDNGARAAVGSGRLARASVSPIPPGDNQMKTEWW